LDCSANHDEFRFAGYIRIDAPARAPGRKGYIFAVGTGPDNYYFEFYTKSSNQLNKIKLEFSVDSSVVTTAGTEIQSALVARGSWVLVWIQLYDN
jgi:hypothetical protein